MSHGRIFDRNVYDEAGAKVRSIYRVIGDVFRAENVEIDWARWSRVERGALRRAYKLAKRPNSKRLLLFAQRQAVKAARRRQGL